MPRDAAAGLPRPAGPGAAPPVRTRPPAAAEGPCDRRERAQEQAGAHLYIRGGHRGHGPSRRPAGGARVPGRLHHLVRQGGELPDDERVREQPGQAERGAGHLGQEAEAHAVADEAAVAHE